MVLSPQLLEPLRQWWRESPRRGVMLHQGWLFPGMNSLAKAVRARLVADLPGWIEENIGPFAPGHHAILGAWMAGMVQNTSRRILLDLQ